MTLNLKGLGSRAIIGAFFKRLEEAQTAGWTADVATMFERALVRINTRYASSGSEYACPPVAPPPLENRP